MSEEQNRTCPACSGTGLLADAESWQYTCSICDGSGLVSAQNQREPTIIPVDEMNRTLR